MVHDPSAGERPWFVWVGSPGTSYLAPWVLASAAHNSALRFVPFSYCFWGSCLSISGTSRVAQNMAIGSGSGSSVAAWLLLSTALSHPAGCRWHASVISASRHWGRLPCRGLGSVHRGPGASTSHLRMKDKPCHRNQRDVANPPRHRARGGRHCENFLPSVFSHGAPRG